MPARLSEEDVERLRKAGRASPAKPQPKPEPAQAPPVIQQIDMKPIADLAILLGEANRLMSGMSSSQMEQCMKMVEETSKQTEAFKAAVKAMADSAPSKDEEWDLQVTSRDQFTGRVRSVKIKRVKR